MGWPWGRGLLWGGLFNDLPAKNKANRLLAAEWMHQESRYFIPTHRRALWAGNKGESTMGLGKPGVWVPFGAQHFTGSLPMVPGVHHSIHTSQCFHLLNILMMSSSISAVPGNSKETYIRSFFIYQSLRYPKIGIVF